MVLIMKKVLILSALVALTAASIGCNRESRQMSLFRGTCLGRMFQDDCGCNEGGEYYDAGYGGDYVGEYGGSCANGQCGAGPVVGGTYPGEVMNGGMVQGGIPSELQGLPTYNGLPIIEGNTHPDLQATPTPALPGPAATTPEN